MNTQNGNHSDKPRVAVLGTGIMGAGMAERLLDQGFSVDVWDRTPAAAARLAERGATAHGRPGEAVHAADVVITMLPTAEAVTDVMLRQDVLAAIPPSGVWAQMGTIGIEATGQLAAAVADRRPEDLAFFDSPVLGTRDPARNGQLTVLASGVKRIAAKLMHFDGAYLRFAGDLQVTRHRGAELVETYKQDAIWELMYFGHAR